MSMPSEAALVLRPILHVFKPSEGQWHLLLLVFSFGQDDVAGCFEYYADLAEKLDKEQDAPFEVPMEQFKCSTRKEPLGVVGLITPW